MTFDLNHGEIMVLYTDGVTEARDADELYGPERLSVRSRRAGPPTTSPTASSPTSIAFQHGQQRDDIAILVIEADAGVGP